MSTEVPRIALCTSESRLDDASYVLSAFTGFKGAREKLPIEGTMIDAPNEQVAIENLKYVSHSGFGMVLAVGYHLGDVCADLAPGFPDTIYVTLDSLPATIPPNLLPVTFAEEHGAFLAGVAAALVSRTGRIGFMGGVDVPLIQRFRSGFEAGVAHSGSGASVELAWAGSFVSYRKGREAAVHLLEQGCDVLFHAAGSAGRGMIREASDRGVWAIGVDSDQSILAPEHVLTSMLKRMDQVIFRVVRDFTEGKVTAGSPQRFGLDGNYIDLSPIHPRAANPEIAARMAQVREELLEGKITVPSA